MNTETILVACRKCVVAAAFLALLTRTTLLLAGTPPAATSTSLTLSSQSVPTGTAVTLTASVQASGVPVAAGLVTFCDAAAIYCEGPNVLGTAQLSVAGIAATKHVFGSGDHSVKAIFAGTHADLASTSSVANLSVSGTSPSTTIAASSGSVGDYKLTATLGYHGLAAPSSSETATFVDTSNANFPFGTADIVGLTAPAYSFITIPSSPVSVGSLPASVVTGDFNADGILDFATANLGDNTVSVFVGDGHGVFTQVSGSPFAVGNGPDALAVADINADGFPDLICAHSAAGTLSVLLGTSGGGFTAGPTLTVGAGPQSIAVGDFNGDGSPDLAVANVYDSTITVLLNDGAGNFTNSNSATYTVGQNPGWIGAADFNQDGSLDLAIVNTTSNNVTVLQGDGNGGFTPLAGSPFGTVAYPVSATLGDFNGDGLADLAIISGTGNSVSILLDTGMGFAATGSTYATGTSPSSIAVSDFNGDGKQDLVITNGNQNDATILFGDGAGAFSIGTQSVAELRSPASVAVADIYGDGTLDLAITNLGGSSTSIRPLQVTRSATATLSSVVVPGAATTHLVTAKYEGDSLYSASTSPAVSLTGSPISTAATLSVSPSASVQFNRVLQLTVVVAPPSASNYTATGTVKFFDGTTQIGQSVLANGQALLSFGSLSVETHVLSAKYSGDVNFTSSAPASINVAVIKATTSVNLIATGGAGAAFRYTATVVPVTSGTPTGSITFVDGTVTLGSVPLVAGIASYNVSALKAGVHTITANYSGDANYGASNSSPVTASSGDFTLTSAKPSNTVLPGKSVAYQLTITPNNSFPNPIAFAVTGLPSGATASFSPGTVTPGAASGSTTMTLFVPAEVAFLHRLPPASGLALALLFLPFTVARRLRRSRTSMLRLLGLVVAILGSVATIATVTGCGSGNGFLGHPPRNYTLTVTASSGTISHTTTVTLNVQ